MTKPTQTVTDKGATVRGRCPAHGDWEQKFFLPLGDAALEVVECPDCAKLPSLRALHIDTVELSGVCDKHGGWSNKVPRFAEKHMEGRCPVCDEETKRAKDAAERRDLMAGAARNRQARVDELFGNAAIPRRFLTRSFDNYRVECDEQKLAHQRAKRYAYKFDQVLSRGASMVFYGKPGTGKNHLSAAIANYVIPNFGASVLFMTVYELMQRIRASYNGTGPSEDVILKELAKIDLLILDEVGVQLGTKHEEVILTDLINRRYADVRPTILLSNLGRDDLEKQLGSRVIDRMEEGGGGSIAFTWDSYRSKVLEDQDLPNQKYERPHWLDDPL